MEFQQKPEKLPYSDLLDQYNNLTKYCQMLQTTNDQNLQEIHDLKRNLQTTTAAETFLSQELDTISTTHQIEINHLIQKHDIMINEFKNQNVQLRGVNCKLEAKGFDLEKQIVNLEKMVSEKIDNSIKEVNDSVNNERENELENENRELTCQLEDISLKLEKLLKTNSEYITELEDLKERLLVAEDNLISKKNDINEKDVQINSLHEKIIELTEELTELKSCPNSRNKKGNSLFAEVDDQRQKMKDILLLQKKQYTQMQKQFQEREEEISFLKWENENMYKEIDRSVSIFKTAEEQYKKHLLDHFQILINDNEKLKLKLLNTEKMLIEVSNSNNATWLESMLNYCKRESAEWKNLLHSCLIKKADVEEALMSTRKNWAKWRFEALQSRCIILNREALLKKHKIEFQPITFSVGEESKHLEPRIEKLMNLDSSVKFIDNVKENSNIDIGNDNSNVNSLSENIRNMYKSRIEENSLKTSPQQFKSDETATYDNYFLKDVNTQHETQPIQIFSSRETTPPLDHVIDGQLDKNMEKTNIYASTRLDVCLNSDNDFESNVDSQNVSAIQEKTLVDLEGKSLDSVFEEETVAPILTLNFNNENSQEKTSSQLENSSCKMKKGIIFRKIQIKSKSINE